MKKYLKLIIVILLVSICCGCSKSQEKAKEELLGINFNIEGNITTLNKYETENPVVAMLVENYGAIVIELYPDKAENTVNNFISLVKSGFYDNNTFHRLVPGFVLQGGDPTGTGTGGPGYSIKGEFINNNYLKNDLKHDQKIVSMARSQNYDSAGSQFFIMLDTSSYLDKEYAAFGKVIDGWDIIEQIESTEAIEDSTTGKLANNLVLKKAIVDTKNKEYPEVEKIESKNE